MEKKCTNIWYAYEFAINFLKWSVSANSTYFKRICIFDAQGATLSEEMKKLRQEVAQLRGENDDLKSQVECMREKGKSYNILLIYFCINIM